MSIVPKKPGDIVTINGVQFVVLDNKPKAAPANADRLFLLLKEPVEKTAFSDDGNNDYTCSKHREMICRWFDVFSAAVDKSLIYGRNLSLLTLDCRVDYGAKYDMSACMAAALTFDEYRKYSHVIPKGNQTYWLATGYFATRSECDSTDDFAMLIRENGDWAYSFCTKEYAIRPAIVVSSLLLDDCRIRGNMDAVFMQFPEDHGITLNGFQHMFSMLDADPTEELSILRIEGNNGYAVGVIRDSVFERLDYDSRPSTPYCSAIRDIINDVEKETADHMYNLCGVRTAII